MSTLGAFVVGIAVGVLAKYAVEIIYDKTP